MKAKRPWTVEEVLLSVLINPVINNNVAKMNIAKCLS